MRSLIGIDNLQLLARMQGDHLRYVLATFLGEGDCLGRSIGIIGTRGDVDDHVVEGVVGPVTTVSVVTGVACCFAQLGSFDISMGFSLAGVPV